MKQTIEIEVPDGKKAVWNNGKIEFIDVDIIELLKSYKNPEKNLIGIIAKEVNEGGGDDLLDLYNEYKNSPVDTHIESIAKLKLFLAYLNRGHKFDLISGDVYYPHIRFYLKSKLPNNEIVIGYFAYKGDIYTLVSGHSYYGSDTGLANFCSFNGYSLSYYSFLACKDAETAQFVATTFGKLLFDVNFGSLIDYEWV